MLQPLFPFWRVTLAALVVWAAVACKARETGSNVRDGGGYSYDNYHGPNMSDPACAADPGKCVCKLFNEYDTDEYRSGDSKSPKRQEWFRQCIGQEIWTKGTAGSGRFHLYVQSQRLGVTPDWGWVFHTEDRAKRFDNWGFVTDPDCCTPGQDCASRGINVTLDQTFGWDFCPGDEALLTFVGDPKRDYSQADPACQISKLEDAIGAKVRVDLTSETAVKRSDSCYLAFGTSAGVVGYRKFPNPRFDKDKWQKLNNGSLHTWENFSRRVPGGNAPDYSTKGGKQRIDDGAVEPPFLIGETCGTCHVGFNPAKPPKDPNKPEWDNILYAIGNIYSHQSEAFAAGIKPGTFEHELYVHIRPGLVDTSAITNDYTHNPGTFNAVINLDQRPGLVAGDDAAAKRFEETVRTYHRQQDGSFAEQTGKQRVPHILKGGEDSIGPQGAIQRVYLNIFSCTEACVGEHLDDQRTLSGRLSRQTPFELDQCRRDCPGYNAIEDRVWDVANFLLRVRPSDLKDAKDPAGVPGGIDGKEHVAAILAKDHQGGGKGAWYAAGRELFAENCAKCHSSHLGQEEGKGAVSGSKVVAIDPSVFSANLDDLEQEDKPGTRKTNKAGVSLDWLGSDVQIPANLVGTYRCRALHTNHKKGHLWQAYASAEYHDKARYTDDVDASQFDFPGERLNKDNLGGAGFYRNVSLLNSWAHAPFMHNNAVGPEWKHIPGRFDIDRGGKFASESLVPSPSVQRRLEMFEKSMQHLLSPEDERDKTGGEKYEVVLTSSPISIPIAPTLPEIPDSALVGGIDNALKASLEKALVNIKVDLPKGMPVAVVASLRHKQLLRDLMKKVSAAPAAQKVKAANDFVASIIGPNPLTAEPMKVAQSLIEKGYANCGDMYDNRGHNFGQDLTDEQKKQLIDFVTTL